MLRILIILSFICSLDLLSARPAEELTKFTLDNIQNNTENIVSLKLEETKELLERVSDAIRIGRGRFVNFVILTTNIIANRAEQINNESRNNLNPLIIKSDKPESTSVIQSTTPIVVFNPQEKYFYRLENETVQGILEKRMPDNIKRLLDSFLTPKPLVDRIKDEEKYGNTGDQFIGIGRMIISGYENLSSFLNNVAEFPVNIAKQTTLKITKTLNELGARIIGLE